MKNVTLKFWLNKQTRTKGFGWACNEKAAVDSMPLRVIQSEPWATVQALLRNKVVHHICVACTAEDIVLHGMPVDKVNHITLCCAESEWPDEWLQVLMKQSYTVERFSSWNEFENSQKNNRFQTSFSRGFDSPDYLPQITCYPSKPSTTAQRIHRFLKNGKVS